MFADGGDVCAYAEPVGGAGGGAVAAGDLELSLDRAQVAFAAVVGERYGQVDGEAQHLGFAVAEAFEQVPRLRLLAPVGSPMFGKPDEHRVSEQELRLGGLFGRDVGQPVLAGSVGGGVELG